VRDEKRRRREEHAVYEAERDRHRLRGARGHNFRLDVIRRNTRSWP
jgi:hypothetical protein